MAPTGLFLQIHCLISIPGDTGRQQEDTCTCMCMYSDFHQTTKLSTINEFARPFNMYVCTRGAPTDIFYKALFF